MIQFVVKTLYDQFKQAMTLEGQQKVNALLDLAKKGNGYTYFPLAEYYFQREIYLRPISG